jgi:hypothetical protein
MSELDLYIDRVAGRQHGVIARGQVLERGSAQQVNRRLQSGRLIRVYDSVYRVPSMPVTWKQELLAACLAGGRPNAAASFRAGAHLVDLPGGEHLVEITTARHRRAQYEGVIAHESHHLEDRDVMLVDAIPVTRPARTLCDLAGLVELGALEQRTLDLALLEAVRRDLVDVRSVWSERDRLGGDLRFGGKVILRALERFVPPIRKPDTRAESELLLLLRAQGLPEPVPQFWLRLPSGERIRLDYAWPWLRVGAEFDPYKYHGDRERYEKNAARTRQMRAMNWHRVCVTDDDLDAGIPESAAALRALLAIPA